MGKESASKTHQFLDAGFIQVSRFWQASLHLFAKTPLYMLACRLARPFRESIQFRFLFIFSICILSILSIFMLTVVSNNFILGIYEQSVDEVRVEMLVTQNIQSKMHKLTDLMMRDMSNKQTWQMAKFNALETQLDVDFRTLGKIIGESSPNVAIRNDLTPLPSLIMWQKSKDSLHKLLALKQNSPLIMKSFYQFYRHFEPLHHYLINNNKKLVRNFKSHLQVADNLAKLFFFYMGFIAVFGCLLLVVMGMMAKRTLIVPLISLQEIAMKLGNKDFSYRVAIKNRHDEIGKLGIGLNLAAAILQGMYAELERRSTHDGLTGVFNRAAFDERLTGEIAKARRYNRHLSLIMLDLDYFKKINDKYGHVAGDSVLKNIATLMTGMVRNCDLVCRYGGEEFAIILPETGPDGAAVLAERLRVAIEKLEVLDEQGTPISFTASIGWVNRSSRFYEYAELVKAADMALYKAKNAGRNQVVSADETSGCPIDLVIDACNVA